jgi:hypothetical protein
MPEDKKKHIHPALIVLKWLLLGGSCKLDQYKYRLYKSVNGRGKGHHYNLCVLGTSSAGKEALLPVDFDIGGFVRACEKVTEKERIEMAANIALNEGKES